MAQVRGIGNIFIGTKCATTRTCANKRVAEQPNAK